MPPLRRGSAALSGQMLKHDRLEIDRLAFMSASIHKIARLGLRYAPTME